MMQTLLGRPVDKVIERQVDGAGPVQIRIDLTE
jgi:hypothetical protein